MTDNIFNEIDFEAMENEGEAGAALKSTCDIGYTFLKEERKKAENEVKKLLDKRVDFAVEGNLTNINEVFKNGFNWYLIDYLYESGVVHYLHTNNKFFKDKPSIKTAIGLKLRYLRLIDNGMNKKDAPRECREDFSFANNFILKLCDEDKERFGKKLAEIHNKGNKAIYYYLIQKPEEEFLLKTIVKEFKM